MIIQVPLLPIERYYREWGCLHAYWKRIGHTWMIGNGLFEGGL